MKKNILETTKVLLILLAAIFSVGVASAWTAPGNTPPTPNVAAPINVSNATQDKLGILNVQGFSNLGTAWFSTSTRDNWPVSKLTLAVNGPVGAKEYCDDNGANCMTLPIPSIKVFSVNVPLGTVLNNGTYSVAHGLGVVPDLFKVTLVNVSAEGGYQPGDEVEITSWYYSSVMANAQNIIFTNDKDIVDKNSNSFSINNKAGNWSWAFCPYNGCDTSVDTGTNAKWRMRFQAFDF